METITSSASLPLPREPTNYDEIAMQQSLLFSDSLKNLRKQLYSAAEYFEMSYTNDDQKQIVVDTLKDYAIKALVNTVDHLGAVTYKDNDLLDEKVDEVSGTELRVSCIEQIFRAASATVNKVVDHFFSHVGGKPVLDELQRNLGFSDVDMEASRMTLYRFGNTSSSSVWYELAYAEAKGRVKKGDRVWQIAFGSGFKCSSVIWHAMRSVGYDETNLWSEEFDPFPVFWNKNQSALVLDKNGSVLFDFTPSK